MQTDRYEYRKDKESSPLRAQKVPDINPLITILPPPASAVPIYNGYPLPRLAIPVVGVISTSIRPRAAPSPTPTPLSPGVSRLKVVAFRRRCSIYISVVFVPRRGFGRVIAALLPPVLALTHHVVASVWARTRHATPRTDFNVVRTMVMVMVARCYGNGSGWRRRRRLDEYWDRLGDWDLSMRGSRYLNVV
jgi:hypothetical protein